jgi:hypothetical protein
MFDALWRVVLGFLLGLAGSYLSSHPLARSNFPDDQYVERRVEDHNGGK